MRISRTAIAVLALWCASAGAFADTAPTTVAGSWTTTNTIINPYAMFGQRSDGKWVGLKTDNNGQVYVVTTALPLPSGSATAANQTAVQSAPGTPQTMAVSVQGNASGVPVPVSAASLPLPSGAAQEAGGNLAAVAANTGTIATNTTGISTAANQSAVQSNPGATASKAVTVQGNVSGVPLPITQTAATPLGPTTLQNAVSASGNGASMTVDGMTTAIFQIAGSFVGTITFQGSNDGSTWTNLNAGQLGTGNSPGPTATAPGFYSVALGGCIKYIQAVVSWVSGTSVTVTAKASMGEFAVRTVNVNQATAANLNATTIQFGPALSTYALAAVSGTATVTGYFVDATGAQVTALQTYSITSATSLTALYNTANSIAGGTALPATYVGFRASLSGSALYLGNGATSTGTLTYSPAAGYSQIATANYFTLGKV